MAPTSRTREVNILITGFGPFMSIDDNPSWLAVKPLHDTQLDLSIPPSLSPSTPSPVLGEGRVGGVGARIQAVQVPVHYGSVLDLVPRIHGSKPLSPDADFWFDSRLDAEHGGVQGEHFPDGYPVEVPVGGFDVVIHVGVGRGGSLRCETQAHKTGYGKPDAHQSFAPLLPNLSPEELATIDRKHLDKDGLARGFGVGYESFSDTETTPVDVPHLVTWLREQGMANEEVEQSLDPGRYLCDFIFYCSLCEAKRCTDGTLVIFIHVPPAGQNLEVPRCTQAIRAIAWYMARKRASVSL